MRHPFLPAATAVTALLLSAGAAAAQACLGLPTRDGQIAVAATGTHDGDTRFGGEFTADVTGPAAFSFGYGGLGGDDDRQQFTARASYEFYLVDPSVCAIGGVLYEDTPEGAVQERLGVPLGFGIGKTIRGRQLDATVFGIPQYVWLQDERVILPGGETDTESSNEFMAETGITLGFRSFYVGGSVVVTTFDDSDPGFRIRAGLLF